MKCSSTTVDSREIDVFKQPKTDSKKNSKRGRITLVTENGKYKTIRLSELDPSKHTEVLQVVYENGVLFDLPTLAEVRARVDANFA